MTAATLNEQRFSRPFAEKRMRDLLGEIAEAAERPEPVIQDLGLAVGLFALTSTLREAEDIAASARIAARELRRAAGSLEDRAAEIDCHVLDQLSDRVLAERAS